VVDVSQFLPFNRARRSARKHLIDRATTEATNGRRLAMYDRGTGLYAPWYMEHRFEEEILRCKRYNLRMSAMIVEGPPALMTQLGDPMADWIRRNIRGCDFAGNLADGRYFLLLPEADTDGADQLRVRLQAGFPGCRIGTAAFPEDGKSYAELRDTAELQLEDAA
jgi:GGDEF domain-containing protein